MCEFFLYHKLMQGFVYKDTNLPPFGEDGILSFRDFTLIVLILFLRNERRGVLLEVDSVLSSSFLYFEAFSK